MNYRTVFHTIGNMLVIEAAILLMPMAVALLYHERRPALSFLLASMLAAAVGFFLTRIDRRGEKPLPRDSMVIVALSWIAISVFGAIPYYASGEVPTFIDGFFEAMSGFTTTGITVFRDVESVSRSILFWRSFTVWLGGMGVLVFMIAVLPRKGGSGSAAAIMQAESTGPEKEKIVPRAQMSASILYLIYIGLSVINLIFLLAGGMSLFDALLTMFGTAGTGGFNIHDQSIAYYGSDYISIVTTVFMFLFGVNYTIFFMILAGRAKNALKNPELRTYAAIIVASSLLIAVNITEKYGSFAKALINSSFAVTAMSSSTGYILENYDSWPGFSRIILLFLMFIGACSGSTSCGIKVSRIIIMAKTVGMDVKKLLNPHSVSIVRYDGRTLKADTVSGVHSFIIMYLAVFTISVILISVNDYDMITSISAVAAALNNVGSGFSMVGPSGSFSMFSRFSMIVLSVDMLAGRLEIFPIFMLFYPRTWSRF